VKVKVTTSVTLSPDAKIGQVKMPKLPKRVGTVQTAFTAVLTLDQETTHHLPISAVVTIDSDAARYDVERGSDVTLLIRRRALRITAAGTALKDADVGDVVSVRVKSTGHTLLARLTSTNEAEVVDSP
jgi:flagella basal body P-ring formation protein FlgA